MVFTPEGFGVI